MLETLTILIFLDELDRKIGATTGPHHPSPNPETKSAETPTPSFSTTHREETENTPSRQQLKTWERDRQSLVHQLSEALHQQYERIRTHRGTALAMVTKGSCGGCRMVIRMAVREKLKSTNELITCEFCGRFLYRPDQASPPAFQFG